jgi:hypothetical protein
MESIASLHFFPVKSHLSVFSEVMIVSQAAAGPIGCSALRRRRLPEAWRTQH